MEELQKYQTYGSNAFQKGQFKEALHYYTNLIKYCDEAIIFIRKKIECMIEMNQLEEAISFSTAIQNKHIDNPEFLFIRGKLLFYSGNTDKGKQFVREALNKDPDNSEYQKFFKSISKLQRLKTEGKLRPI